MPLELPEREFPGITLTGFGLLSGDGRRLLIGGTTHNATRLPDRDNSIQTSQVPHPAVVYDTEKLRFIAELDTPVSNRVATVGTWAVTSETSESIYCDQECDPANSDPEVLSSRHEWPGLTLIDQTNFEVRGTLRPGAEFYHFAGVSGQQVIVENFADDGNYYLSIDALAAEITGQIVYGDTFLVTTDDAVFEMQHGS